MGLFSFDEWKDKAQELLSESAELAKELGQQAADYLEEKIPEVAEKVSEFVDENAPKVEVFIKETTTKVKQRINDINEMNKKREIMNHKVIMLGGRRAGKSTILASILHSLKNEIPGTICTVNDSKTDYTQVITDKDGKKHQLPTLDNKRIEVSQYIKTHHQNQTFLVDMDPTYGKSSYILTVRSGTASVDLEFVDVPGEWMRKNVAEHNELKEQVMSSDIFVIAIDTPFLMQEDNDVNDVYNRVQEITDVISEMKVDPKNEVDRRLIILCPIKCEKWVRERNDNKKPDEDELTPDKVTQKVKTVYKNLINQWVKFPNVDIWIMPIQTVGGLESVKLMPAKRYKKDAFDKNEKWKSCMVDELTDQVIDKDGKCITDKIDVEDDERWVIDYTAIPLSWYRNNGLGFAPVFCGQPGYHILHFLVDKEEEIVKQRAEMEQQLRKKIEDMSLLEKLFNFRDWIKTWDPTFGEYLPVWQNAIHALKERKLIKEEGDGFELVKSFVE